MHRRTFFIPCRSFSTTLWQHLAETPLGSRIPKNRILFTTGADPTFSHTDDSNHKAFTSANTNCVL